MKNADYAQMIQELKESALRDLVRQMAESSSEAERVLLNYLKAHAISNRETEKAASARMKKAEASFRAIWDDACIVLDAMDEGDWEELSERGFTGYYFEDANIEKQLNSMSDILKKEQLSETFRREMMEEMLETFDGSDYCGDDEFSVAEQLCYTDADRLYFAVLLKERDTEHARIARILKAAGTETQYVSYLEEAQHKPQNALELYRRALAQGDRKDAHSYLWNCLSVSPYSREILDVLLDDAETGSVEDGCAIIERIMSIQDDRIVSHYLEEYGRMYRFLLKNQIAEMRYALVLKAYCAAGSGSADEWFRICTSDLPEELFQENAGWILEHLKRQSPQTYYCYRIDHGETEEALEALKADRSYEWTNRYTQPLDSQHVISRKLQNRYPQEIYELYWREADCYGKDKDRYAQCAALLRELKSYANRIGNEKNWSNRFGEFVEQHKRRRYLMQELKKAKLLG